MKEMKAVSNLNIGLVMTPEAVEALANEIEARVRRNLLGAFSVAVGPSRKLDVHQPSKRSYVRKDPGQDIHPPLDPTMKELVINSAISKSDHGIRSVRSIEVATAVTTPATPVTSKQVEAAWREDGRFDELGRGWFKVKVE